jgi:PRTase ComF-like
MRLNRLQLATLVDRSEIVHITLDPRCQIEICLSDYARFKHGDSAKAPAYAKSLAHLAMSRLKVANMQAQIFVATPPRRKTPSAVHSLVDPFMNEVSSSFFNMLGAPEPPRKVSLLKRQTAIPGLYALPRREAISRLVANTIVEEADDLRGSTVVFLDDIRVAGLREESTAVIFRELGVAAIVYAYILRCVSAPVPAAIEKRINSTFVSMPGDLISIATSPHFVPNVRFCKALLSLQSSDRRAVLLQLSPHLRQVLLYFIRSDNIEKAAKDAP